MAAVKGQVLTIKALGFARATDGRARIDRSRIGAAAVEEDEILIAKDGLANCMIQLTIS